MPNTFAFAARRTAPVTCRIAHATRKAPAVATILLALLPLYSSAQAQSSSQGLPAAQGLVATMLANEQAAATHKVYMSYQLVEKSERTAGQTWTERVVETPTCRVRLLQSINGQPLAPDRAAAERNRLDNYAEHPEEYAARENQLNNSDDAHAQAILGLLGKAFILDNVQSVGSDWHIDYRPDPAFSPSGSEDKVLHGMVGWVAIDKASMRLHHIEGRLPEDVSLFGFLASVHAGSHVAMTTAIEYGTWRTVRVVTVILGKAVLFKSIGRNTDATRSDFRAIPQNLTVAQAVTLLEKP